MEVETRFGGELNTAPPTAGRTKIEGTTRSVTGSAAVH